MTPEERQLIQDLFDRMRSYAAPEKDREAEDLIYRSVRANPEAPYLLVQSVLVQEQTLQQADQRIRDLEDRVRELEAPAQPQRAASSSFLGSLSPWGRSEQPARGSSVPQVGARAAPSAYDAQPQRPWSQQPQAPQQQAAAGGGFMRTALTAAAGVAGGMLLADGIRSMMGSGSAHAATPAAGSQTGADSDAGYSGNHGFVNDSDNDPGASYNDGNDPGFDSGGDFDI